MRVGNRIRFCTTLLVGAAALTVAYHIAKEASWTLEATVEASPQTPANPPPIPAAGPLAEPKSFNKWVSTGGHSRGGAGGQSADA